MVEEHQGFTGSTLIIVMQLNHIWMTTGICTTSYLNVYSHTLDHGFQWPNGYCTELELGKYLVSGQFALAEETYASLVAIIF